jgi:mycofactocin precursor peptide peptidase
MSTELAHAVWPDLVTTGRILLVPVGATEQHGPHLPIGTDTELAVAVARAAAARDQRLLVAPAVAYGSSGEHDGFAGTLSIGQDATELLLVELCRSATATFDRVVLVCTHGGNAAPVRRAVATLRAEGREVIAFAPQWGGDAHAGRTETSLMLAIAPQRVLREAARTGDTRPLAELIGALETRGVRELSANGVLGDPAGADAAEGRMLLAAAADALLAVLKRSD